MLTGMKKAIATAAAATAVAAGGVLLTPGMAHAASYNGVCGSGYSVIDQSKLGQGTVFLAYNSSNGNNCVVTIRNSSGSKMYMNAAIRRSGDSTWVQDPGDFTTYAGPVRISARKTCIDWGGQIGSETAVEYGTHCG